MKSYCAYFLGARVYCWQPDAYFDDLARAKAYVLVQLASNPRVAAGYILNTLTDQVELYISEKQTPVTVNNS